MNEWVRNISGKTEKEWRKFLNEQGWRQGFSPHFWQAMKEIPNDVSPVNITGNDP